MPALGSQHNSAKKTLDVYGINVQKFLFESREDSHDAQVPKISSEIQMYGTPEQQQAAYIASEITKSR